MSENNKFSDLFFLLEGRKMMIMTDMKVEVELTIKEVKENRHSRKITPDTRENDWWGESESWTTYTVFFTNGAQKNFDNLSQIKVIVEKPLIG